jgi:hypothetical protein
MNNSDNQDFTDQKNPCRKDFYREYRAVRRKSRLKMLDVRAKAIKASKDLKEIGFLARRCTEKGKIYKLPKEFAFILKACEEFIHNPNRFPSLNAFGGFGMKRKDARTNVARVLAVLLSRTNLIEGRIGVTTQNGVEPISENQLMKEYILRFGKNIEPSQFSKAVRYLKDAGYLNYSEIKVGVERDGEKVIRSAPSYKQFTEKFFQELQITQYTEVAESIIDSRIRDSKKGLAFIWIPFTRMAGRLQRYVNAEKLNKTPLLPYHLALGNGASPHIH